MQSRLSVALALTALAALAAAPRAHANPAEVTVGMLRSPVNRAGAPLRAEPKMGGKILGQVPHGARLTVKAVESGWLQVTTDVTGADGKSGSQTGWLRAVETVQPYALTSGVGAARGVADAQSAAGAARGFGPQSEEDLAATDADIRAALPLVDRVEQAVPSPAAVATFAKQGRLGMPGRTR